MDEDRAYIELTQRLDGLIAEASQPLNEATTRLRLIDVLLFDVLGWDRGLVETEKYCRAEGFSDYELRAPNGAALAIIEAKKTSASFVLPDRKIPDRPYSLAYLGSECPAARDAYQQALGYAVVRRDWVDERLRLLVRSFSVEVASFAIMANHLHLVLRMRPEGTQDLTAELVARRWLAIYPASYHPDGTPRAPSEELVRQRAQDWAWVARRRKRLADLGWFMKALKEGIARRANREDGCTGAFWEGRYTSVPLLDQQALIACMAYVDLNPIRAGIATTPEDSPYTSIRLRARAYAARRGAPPPATRGDAIAAARWLAPLSRCVVGDDLATPLTEERYLALVDATGRVARSDKRGAIAPELPTILARLDLPVDAWVQTMTTPGGLRGGGVGGGEARRREAIRRGVRWVRAVTALFAA